MRNKTKDCIKIIILTISNRAYTGEYKDLSGPAIKKILKTKLKQVKIVNSEILPDNFIKIKNKLIEYCDNEKADLILTTGGTGLAPTDVTPEATLKVMDKSAPGLAEAMRSYSLNITKFGMLSRAVAGVRKKTLIINLPGSPKGAVENLKAVLSVLPHAVDVLKGKDHIKKFSQKRIF